MTRILSLWITACLLALGSPTNAKQICTLIAEPASGEILLEQGDCTTRVTPASTFKIALALIGYDTGFLIDARTPRLPYKTEYVAWGGENWTQTTDPERWLKYSVVWYSQQITKALGQDTLERYARAFQYGTADFSGDAGKNNGLERAWIESSLKISPKEQVAFLSGLVNHALPVRAESIDKTRQIVEAVRLENGWTPHGKTGSAYPRNADGSFNRARARGWFVGWAEKDGKTLVFARLNQDEKRTKPSSGLRARQGFITDWPALIGSLP
nr:class D beta-lactamase [Amylibacter sp.]